MKTTRNELVLFFLIAFGWMWLINLPRVLAAHNMVTLHPAVSEILKYMAVFGPSVAAFLLTGLHAGKAGLKTLWQRGWQVDFPKIWWLPTFLLVPVAGAITWILLRLLDQPVYWEYGLPPAMIVPIGLLIWLLGAYPEEYGWRGYALDRLQKAFNPLTASLILGFLWGIWHLPLHLIPGTTQAVIPVWEFVAQTIVLTVIYTWLHNGTGGSVLIASLFHAMGNLTGAVFPYWATATGRWTSFLVLLIPALIIVVRQNRYYEGDLKAHLGEPQD